jgi:hypothetical protein
MPVAQVACKTGPQCRSLCPPCTLVQEGRSFIVAKEERERRDTSPVRAFSGICYKPVSTGTSFDAKTRATFQNIHFRTRQLPAQNPTHFRTRQLPAQNPTHFRTWQLPAVTNFPLPYMGASSLTSEQSSRARLYKVRVPQAVYMPSTPKQQYSLHI